MNAQLQTSNREQIVKVSNGWVVLPLILFLFFGSIALFVYSIAAGVRGEGHPVWSLFVLALLLLPVSIILFVGFFTLQPNEARVLILFGAYKGTVRTSGFHWGNPFYTNGPQPLGHTAHGGRGKIADVNAASALTRKTLGRNKISLRARTLNGDKLKVNDKRGNPIEIAAVVVWRVADTAQAMFDVDNYGNYIPMQSESALRHLANQYSYEYGEDAEPTFR